MEPMELVAAAGATRDAARVGRSALRPLTVWDSFGAGDLTWRVDPLASEVAALNAQAIALVNQAHTLLAAAVNGLDEFGDWLAMAALIYQGAEEQAAGYLESCVTLQVPGCQVGAPVPGSSTLGSVGSLVTGLPTTWKSFKGPLDYPATTGLTTEFQLADLSAKVVGGAQPTVAGAAAIGAWWQNLGAFFAGTPLGVAVMDQSGRTMWASRATLAGGRPVEVASKGGGPSSHPLSVAVRRLNSLAAAPSTLQGAFQAAHRAHPDGVVSQFIPRGRHTPKTPLAASALLSTIEASGANKAAGQVQIIKHQGKRKNPSWSVVVRGTTAFLPTSTNPQDMASNFQAVGKTRSDQQVAVELAMEMAGIGKGDPVEIVGHSQGGAVALAIAGNARLAQKYNVVSVLTAGAPSGGQPIPKKVAVLNLENMADPVPALDGRPAPRGQDIVTAHFDARGLDVPQGSTAHDVDTYVAAAKKMESQVGADPQLDAVGEWSQRRLQAMGLDEGSVSEARFYNSVRVR